MDTTFVEPTPVEAQMAVLQFMGQHVTGELKQLESNLVSRNQTLVGMTLQPEAVLNSVASLQPVVQQPVSQPVPQIPVANSFVTPVVSPQPSLQVIQPPSQPAVDQDQLEFSFETNPLSQRIFDEINLLKEKLYVISEFSASLERIEQKLTELEKKNS